MYSFEIDLEVHIWRLYRGPIHCASKSPRVIVTCWRCEGLYSHREILLGYLYLKKLWSFLQVTPRPVMNYYEGLRTIEREMFYLRGASELTSCSARIKKFENAMNDLWFKSHKLPPVHALQAKMPSKSEQGNRILDW
jgi:hypothetical protein